MARNNGYISLWRKLRENPIYSNSKAVHIWIECLMRATYKDRTIYQGREKIKLKSGQFLMGYEEFADTLSLPTSTVYFWLGEFEDNDMVKIKSNTKGTIVTIKNWEDYQELKNEKKTNEKQKENEKKASEKQGLSDKGQPLKNKSKAKNPNENGKSNNSNKSVKNEKKASEKREESNNKVNKGNKLYSYWCEKSETISHRKFTKKMKSAVNARLEDGYSLEEIKQAIDNYNMVLASDDYFFSYDNWALDEFLSRGEGEQVEKFLENPEGFRKDEDNNSDKKTRRQPQITEEEKEYLYD